MPAYRRWLGVAVAGVIVVAAVVPAGGVTLRMRDERNAALSTLVNVRQNLANQKTAVGATLAKMKSYRHSFRLEKQAFQSQTNLDKSALRDCWTVIVRLVPRPRLVVIFGTLSGGGLIRSAWHRGSLGFHVRRCAAAAVP
jgi:hypothetical protein